MGLFGIKDLAVSSNEFLHSSCFSSWMIESFKTGKSSKKKYNESWENNQVKISVTCAQ